MTAPGGTVRLRRSLGARLFSGWTFQPVLTVALLLNICLFIGVSTFAGSHALHDLVPAIPFYLIWLIGICASAHADGDGVRWRYFVPHRYTWAQIEHIQFGGVVRSTMGGTPAVLVTVNGRTHAVGPGIGVKRRYQAEFAEAVRVLAAAHGVPATVQDGNAFWTPLLGS